MHFTQSLLAAAVAASPALAAYSINTYWGQSGLDTDRLGNYCKKGGDIDFVTIGFVYLSPENDNGVPGTNFAAHCGPLTYTTPAGKVTQLLTGCDQIQADIKVCQDAGIKVLLSIGGQIGQGIDYTVSSDAAGVSFAQFMYNAFGPTPDASENYSGPRPFDISASEPISVDGFDFDLEMAFTETEQDAYVAMVGELRRLIDSRVASQGMILTAAPECPLSDEFFKMKDIIAQAKFDKLFIQFYNNAVCDGRDLTTFNLAAWESMLTLTDTVNAKTELYVGLPGAAAAASDGGYIEPSDLTALICQAKGVSSFAGIMLWDAVFAGDNVDASGISYTQHAREALDACCPGQTCTTSSSSSSASATSSATSVSSASASASVTSASSASASASVTIGPISSVPAPSSSLVHFTNSSTSSTAPITSTSAVVPTSSGVIVSPTFSWANSSTSRVDPGTSTGATTTTTPGGQGTTTTNPGGQGTTTTNPGGQGTTTPGGEGLTTSTVFTTSTYTITSCAPTVTNCPLGSVTTEVIALYTTVCPGNGPQPTGVPVSTETVYSTKTYTITSCAPTVTNCPVGQLTTEVVTLYTTIYGAAAPTTTAPPVKVPEGGLAASTVYITTTYTVTACAAGATNCVVGQLTTGVSSYVTLAPPATTTNAPVVVTVVPVQPSALTTIKLVATANSTVAATGGVAKPSATSVVTAGSGKNAVLSLGAVVMAALVFAL